jgi:Immunity protein 8
MPIRPIIKGYYSSDVENLSTWIPADRVDVYYPLELSIGTHGHDRTDIFQVVVATPEAMRSRFSTTRKCLAGRHVLLVADHDWPSIAKYCETLVEACYDDTWERVASRLGRFFRSEFEDYTQAKE